MFKPNSTEVNVKLTANAPNITPTKYRTMESVPVPTSPTQPPLRLREYMNWHLKLFHVSPLTMNLMARRNLLPGLP